MIAVILGVTCLSKFNSHADSISAISVKADWGWILDTQDRQGGLHRYGFHSNAVRAPAVSRCVEIMNLSTLGNPG